VKAACDQHAKPPLHADLVVNASRPLLIDSPSFAAEQDVDPPIAIAHARLANRSNAIFERGLTGGRRER
jgi:hypothetical protein